MNKVILVGRTTKDIELVNTTSGKTMTTFSLAVNRSGGQDGADFINCQAWEKRAELLNEYVPKGTKIGIVGHLNTYTWETKDGTTMYGWNVVVDELEFLESKPKEEQDNKKSYNKYKKGSR